MAATAGPESKRGRPGPLVPGTRNQTAPRRGQGQNGYRAGGILLAGPRSGVWRRPRGRQAWPRA